MAGVPGFEPGNAGIKIQCLTAWRYPTKDATLLKSMQAHRLYVDGVINYAPQNHQLYHQK